MPYTRKGTSKTAKRKGADYMQQKVAGVKAKGRKTTAKAKKKGKKAKRGNPY